METQKLHLISRLSFSNGIGDYDILFELLFGMLGVIIGWFVFKKIKNPQTKNEINFSAVFSMCFSGTLIILKEVTEFFIDFYKGTNLLHCEFIDDDHWFFRLFGFGMSPHEQRPLFDTDEDMLLSLLSTLLTTALLYLRLRRKNKALYIKSHVKKSKSDFSLKAFLKGKLLAEREKLKRDCTTADYLLWWCTRIPMIYAFFVMEVRAEANLLLANLVATFAITLIHLIFPQKSFFSQISYRAQSLITVIVFLGSYCGNYVMVYSIVGRFDLFLHFISGVLCVLGGYYISKTLIKAETKRDVLLIALFSLCFSCMIMPAWEVSEFIGDFIWGTSNQGFYWGPTEDSFLFVLFGRGSYDVILHYLFDTFYDVLLALSTTIPTAALLYAYLRVKLKRDKITVSSENETKNPAEKSESEKSPVLC